jgi:putative ABC transport system permease protein
LVLSELVRAPGRTFLRVLTLAIAVGLLAAMVLFVGHSLGTMTGSAVRGVPIDWQGPVGSYRAATRVAARTARMHGIAAAAVTATAPFAGVEHVSPTVGTIRAGSGAILAVPPRYLAQIGALRFLRGSLEPGDVVFDQQLAATLQVQPGDMVALTPRSGTRPVRLRVSGIALVTAPDQLFQPLNPALGPAPAQPPANIAILPIATFAARVAPSLPAISTASGVSAVPGAQQGTQWQVQAQVSPAALGGTPAHALTAATRLRNRVERSLPGQVVFVDNLSDSLSTASGDALYAEPPFTMLALPGALVALGLAYLAALGTAGRDRRNLGLLRARGARRRDLVSLALVESMGLGLVAGALGMVIALAALRFAGSAGRYRLGPRYELGQLPSPVRLRGVRPCRRHRPLRGLPADTTAPFDCDGSRCRLPKLTSNQTRAHDRQGSTPYLDHEHASDGDLSFIGLGDAESGFSAREAEERLEAEGFTP